MKTIALVCCAALFASSCLIAETGSGTSTSDGALDTRDLTAAPVNLAPTNNALVATLWPELTSSAFAPSFSGVTHFASQWQVAFTNTFSSNVWDSGESTAALITATVGADLVITSRYCWRVRHKSDTGSWSPWSTATWLRTAPLACSFTADKTIGLNSLNVQFTGNAWGTNVGSYYYRWDFDYPSGIDWEGDGENTPANFYNTPGVYAVYLSVSNSAGQVAYALRTGYITVLSNVQAAFSAVPLTGAAPLVVQFTDTSLNQPQFWFWNFNGGGIDSTNQNPQFTYMATGQYTVALTVSNDFGAQGRSAATLAQTNFIVVTEPLPITPDFYAVPLTGVPPLTVQFYNTSSANALYWFWDFNNDGVVDSTAKHPAYVFATPGAHTVTLTASNDVKQVATLTRAGYIYVVGNVQADFTVAASAIVGEDVQFTDTSSGNPTSWAWDFENNGSVDSILQNPVTNYATVGWKTVKLTASNLYSASTIVKTNALKVTGPSPFHYVANTAVAITPYTNWANAATNIQDALAVAQDFDYVYISNGVYASSGYVKDGTNVFIVDKAVDVVGGAAPAEFPVIDGRGTMRGAHVSAGSISGVRFVNGNAPGSANLGRGGGIFCLTGTLDRCILSGNSAKEGGGIYARDAASLRSCLAISNTATLYGGGLGLRAGGSACNLTIADNAAIAAGGGVYCNSGGDLWNCIIYSNSAPSSPDYYNGGAGMSYNYCCLPTDPGGVSNITAQPAFMPDYSITWGSPCRDKGIIFVWMTAANDLSGNPRVAGGRVDIGAYEAIPEPCAGLLSLLSLWFARRRQTKVGATAVSRTSSQQHSPHGSGSYILGAAVFIVIAAMALSTFAVAPVVSNVRHAQRPGTKLLDITYDVDDADADLLKISVAASSNSGATFNLPVTNLIGARYVTSGANKQITWDAGLDWNGRFTTNLRVRITADDNAVPPGMLYIPAGTFQMGQTGIAEPVHTVTLSAFFMDKYETTYSLWTNVYQWATNNGYAFNNAGSFYNNPTNPVHTVNWYDCVKWCNARSQKEGLVPCYYTDAAQTGIYKEIEQLNLSTNSVKWTANGYRLPTEAEWEYAARGGTTTTYPWGETITATNANYNSNVGSTTVVGSYPANGYGLYDMIGNVLEWNWDWYGSYTADPQSNPVGPASGTYRVIRGGGWGVNADYCRSAYRDGDSPGGASGGFRLVLPAGQ